MQPTFTDGLVKIGTKATEEAPGVQSSSRLVMVRTVYAVLAAFVVLTLAIALGKLKDIPPGVTTFGTMLFLGAIGGKVANGRLNEQ